MVKYITSDILICILCVTLHLTLKRSEEDSQQELKTQP